MLRENMIYKSLREEDVVVYNHVISILCDYFDLTRVF